MAGRKLSIASRAAAAATAAAALGLALSTAPASAAHSCRRDGYAYAGVVNARPASGVSATIAPAARLHLSSGHVAAWVGVGGEGMGRGGADEWLQAGLSVRPTGMALYFEVQQRSRAPRFVMLKGNVKPWQSFRVSIVEARDEPGAWEVWVDGTQMTRAIYLPGSHGAWRPMATAESWAPQPGVCNGFGFSFSSVNVASQKGWAPIDSRPVADPGLRVIALSSNSFIAQGAR